MIASTMVEGANPCRSGAILLEPACKKLPSESMKAIAEVGILMTPPIAPEPPIGKSLYAIDYAILDDITDSAAKGTICPCGMGRREPRREESTRCRHGRIAETFCPSLLRGILPAILKAPVAANPRL